MTTGNMPNPPDRLTNQAPTEAAKAQTQPGIEAGEAPTTFDLASDVATIIEGQVDVLAQRLVYHTQLMYGVGALGVDVVTARNSVVVFANALRNGTEQAAVHTLVCTGTSQNPQINDMTLPFKNNGQVAGLLEGLILDAVMFAYRDDPARQHDARLLIDSYAQAANEQLQRQTRSLGPVGAQAAQGSGGHPNARS
jgi:hypothetical protein